MTNTCEVSVLGSKASESQPGRVQPMVFLSLEAQVGDEHGAGLGGSLQFGDRAWSSQVAGSDTGP